MTVSTFSSPIVLSSVCGIVQYLLEHSLVEDDLLVILTPVLSQLEKRAESTRQCAAASPAVHKESGYSSIKSYAHRVVSKQKAFLFPLILLIYILLEEKVVGVLYYTILTYLTLLDLFIGKHVYGIPSIWGGAAIPDKPMDSSGAASRKIIK